jgi:signal transduction histidine kinase
MRRRWPATAHGQIIGILLLAMIATITLMDVTLRLSRPEVPPQIPGPWPDARQVAATLSAMHAVSPDDRPRLAEALSTGVVRVTVGSHPACPPAPLTRQARDLEATLSTLLDRPVGPIEVSSCQTGSEDRALSQVRLPADDVALMVVATHATRIADILYTLMPLIVALAFLLILVILLSIWTLWRINRPLRLLANRVDSFALDVPVAPLMERGPREIRQVAHAFNRMQERVARSIEERTRMLIAVGHDLRTPLTRIKLRIDMDDTLATRQDLRRDLDLMHKMVNGALSFLNQQSDSEAWEPVDLGALVESVCIEFADCGKAVSYAGPYGLECRCQPTAIARAVSNLIDNGSRYGARVVATVSQAGDQAVIEVRDDGPGIPEEMRDVALLPFARLDPARASDGGLGLGLSIVADIVGRHRGRLSLLDAKPSGLLARIELPLGRV